ncbi:hypothetical protein M8J75_004341 [Diaphorina citri]|nr:hypothetical protein M8J75_004341 [Diaphorina citri]
MTQRSKVVQLYKTFLHLGKDYPKGFDYFRLRLKNAFMKNAQVQDPEKIDQMIKHGEFVVKEIQALYMLKKYRTLKQRLVLIILDVSCGTCDN